MCLDHRLIIPTQKVDPTLLGKSSLVQRLGGFADQQLITIESFEVGAPDVSLDTERILHRSHKNRSFNSVINLLVILLHAVLSFKYVYETKQKNYSGNYHGPILYITF